MSKKMRKIVTGLLVVSALCMLATGCGSSKNDIETATAEKVEVTTKEEVTTAEQTMEEPNTEETTTEYVEKGMSIGVEKKNAENFRDLVIENGYTFYINDFCSDPSDSMFRGETALVIMSYLGIDTAEFEEKYFPLGAQAAKIPYEDNYSFTYTGDKKFIFTFMFTYDEFMYFDLHEVE